jgi:lysozyme family protein
MIWRVAKSLEQLLAEINTFAPQRSKASDGGIGNAEHAARTSDHNPYIKDKNGIGVVRARDYTHDPKGGFDAYFFAKALAKSGDPRIRYIISNGRIFTPSVSSDWRPYYGSNDHSHHTHVSVSESAQLYDKTDDWKWEDEYWKLKGSQPIGVQPPGERPAQTPVERPVLKRGSKGTEVKDLQAALKIKADGDFGPATERAVKAFQTQRGIEADGVVGFYTWKAINAANAVTTALAPPLSTFDRVMEYIIDDEGDELNMSPNEPGGASRYGVSIDALSKFLKRKATVQDLKALTPSSVSQIYKQLYADPIHFDKLPVGFNYAALDFGINSGIAHVDGEDNMAGVKDSVTEALKESSIFAQINKLCDLRLAWMKTRADWPKYKAGWTARVDRVRNRSQNLAK